MKRKKALGQCFLEDRNILRLEARLADVRGRRVLEIGAGDGRLTEAILEHEPERVFAVEKDPRLAEALRKRFADVPVDIIEGDFLELDTPEADVIVGNIPYYISSDIVFSLKDLGFDRAVLMVQKEFAQKMTAKPGERNYGRLSVTSQVFFEIRYERTVLRHLFRPVPDVDSAIIILKPTGKKLTQFEENMIRSIFQHKNKTVRNALLDSKLFEAEELEELGGFAKRRGRTLTKEECLEIAALLKNL